MKTLAVTFLTAAAIVIAALAYDKATNTNSLNNDIMIGKTIVTHDAAGRPVNQITLTTNGKQWEETMMKQTTYEGDSVKTATFSKQDGQWVATTMSTYTNVEGTLILARIEYAAPNGKWATQAELNTDDLSEDNGLLNDIVFDANGTLVMNATYIYDNGNRKGLQKEEYQYSDNKISQTVSYTWEEDGEWQKHIVANQLAK